MTGPKTVPPEALEAFDFGGLGVEWRIDGPDAGDRFTVVHHPIAPRALAAPLHRHHREDEYSYVLRGALGALLGEDVVTAGPGTWVFKPRGQWHTFWNAGDDPCYLIEVISPGGFENYFREVAASWGGPGGVRPDQRQVRARHGLRQRAEALRAVRADVPGAVSV